MLKKNITIRKAQIADSDRVLEWRNDPITRRFFLNRDPVDPSEHRVWYASVLADENRHLLIAQDEKGSPIGVVRFDKEGDNAQVSIYIVPSRRGFGHGRDVLLGAIRWLTKNSSVKRVHANVVRENLASRRMFSSVGFAGADDSFYLDLIRQ